MPERLARAHLVICRAGASTVAELAAVGRPALLVPYPYATDDHQTANAARLRRRRRRLGRCRNAGLPPDALTARLIALFADPAVLAERRRRAPAVSAGDDAAERLAALVLELGRRRNGRWERAA